MISGSAGGAANPLVRAMARLLALVLLAHAMVSPGALAVEVGDAAGASVACRCPDAGDVSTDDGSGEGGENLPFAADECEQCACCAGPGGAALVSPGPERVSLTTGALSVVDAVEPAPADPRRIPKPPERSSR